MRCGVRGLLQGLLGLVERAFSGLQLRDEGLELLLGEFEGDLAVGGGGVGGLGSVREVQLKAPEGLAYFSDFVAGENLVDLKSGGGRRDGSVDRVGGRGHAR